MYLYIIVPGEKHKKHGQHTLCSYLFTIYTIKPRSFSMVTVKVEGAVMELPILKIFITIVLFAQF